MAGLKGRKQYVLALRQGVIEATNDLGRDAMEKIKDFTPVRTGTLRDGFEYIEATPQDPTGRIVNDVEYLPYVNDGTPRQAPALMIERGLDAVDKDMRRRLRKVSR